jgi:cell division protein FtsL
MIEYYGEAATIGRRRVTDKLNDNYATVRKNIARKSNTTSRKRTTSNVKTKATSRKSIISKIHKSYVFMGLMLFILLFLITYRAALINTNFSEKESLKKELSKLEKENAQLQVNIEQQMNVSKIEQEASERLGMKKLDTNQKVYVSLDKKDYTESSLSVATTDDESWVNKFISVLKGE